VLVEMELAYHLQLSMVVTEMVEILLSQFLVELLLPKVVEEVLDLVVTLHSYLDLVTLIILHPKVDLVVVVLGNKELVLHLTKGHFLVGHLMETLEVTELVEKTTLVLAVEVLAGLVLILLSLLEVQVVQDNYSHHSLLMVKMDTSVGVELVVLIPLPVLPLVVSEVVVTVLTQVTVLVVAPYIMAEMLLTELAVVAVALRIVVMAITLTNRVMVETEPFLSSIKV
tara:strand:+ start:80 stop:757 length:678 start_codon:yes stop_codon:yes gene_type:complete